VKTLYAAYLCVFGLALSACEQPYQISTSGNAKSSSGQEVHTPTDQPSGTPVREPSPLPISAPTDAPIPITPPTLTPIVPVIPPPPVVVIPDPVVTQSPAPVVVPPAPIPPVVVTPPSPAPVVIEKPVPPPVVIPVPPPVVVTPPVPPVVPVPAPSPCVQISQVTEDIRVMLMVDNSEFTQVTDPDHAERVAAIDNFITTYANKTNLTYSYGCFATKAYIYNMKPGGSFLSNTGYPFGDVREARAALDMFKTIHPHGVSNYKTVFGRLQEAIVDDESSSRNGKQNYVVVFISAGRPNDLGRTAQSQISGITQLVTDALQAAGPGRLTFSTVFIGDPRDTQAINNLQMMADVGGGQFVEANSSQTVHFNDIINVPGTCAAPTN
jgi:hypothetical protein